MKKIALIYFMAGLALAVFEIYTAVTKYEKGAGQYMVSNEPAQVQPEDNTSTEVYQGMILY